MSLYGKASIYKGKSWGRFDSIDNGVAVAGLSCPTPRFCVALNVKGYAIVYDGTSWSIPRSSKLTTRPARLSPIGLYGRHQRALAAVLASRMQSGLLAGLVRRRAGANLALLEPFLWSLHLVFSPDCPLPKRP